MARARITASNTPPPSFLETDYTSGDAARDTTFQTLNALASGPTAAPGDGTGLGTAAYGSVIYGPMSGEQASTGVNPPSPTDSTYNTTTPYNTTDAVAGVGTVTNATASTAPYTPAITPGKAAASTSEATTRTVGQDELAATHLDRILGKDSPLMVRARQEGLLSAGRRGLQNSSLAAGAAMGAMVDRASPIALQDSRAYVQAASENMQAQNTTALANAGLITEVSLGNAGFQTQANVATGENTTSISGLNAKLGTDVSLTNATNATNMSDANANRSTDVSLANSAARTQSSRDLFMFNGQRFLQDDAQAQTILEMNLDDFQKTRFQHLLGRQAKDLLKMENENKLLLQSNATAGVLYQAYFGAMGSIMSNHEISPEAARTQLRTLATALNGGFKMLQEVSGVDLSDLISIGENGLNFNTDGILGNQNYTPIPGSLGEEEDSDQDGRQNRYDAAPHDPDNSGWVPNQQGSP